MLMERIGARFLRSCLVLLSALFGLMMFSGCGASDDAGKNGQVVSGDGGDRVVTAYVKESGNDLGWYHLDPVSAKRGELVSAFGGDLWPQVTNDGTKMATSDGHSPNLITIRDSDGIPVPGPALYGDTFDWNPSGKLGAYNLGDFDGPFAVVDDGGNPADDWAAVKAKDSSTGQPIELAAVAFESWVTDDVMFVTVDGTAGLARMDGDELSVTTNIDIDNPNYPAFDKQGKGIFADENALRQINVEDGTISDLAQFDPAPESDYIARQTSWSPVSSTFSYSAPDSEQICDWDDTLTCWPVSLPSGFTSEGATFSLDGETVAFDGYQGAYDADWHPYLVNLVTKQARPLPFQCGSTCYVYAFVATSPKVETETTSTDQSSDVADWTLDPDGIGPLRLGMDATEATSVAPGLVVTPGQFCDSWRVPGLAGVNLLVPPEGLRAIAILPDSIHGPSGIGPGSSASEMKAQFGSDLTRDRTASSSLGYDYYYLNSSSGESTIQFVVDKAKQEVLFVEAGYPGEFYYPDGNELCA